MDSSQLVLVGYLVAIVAVILGFLFLRKRQSAKPDEQPAAQANAAPARGGALARMRRGQQQQQQQAEQHEGDAAEAAAGEESESDDDVPARELTGKEAKKAAEKLRKKQEKEEMRKAMEAAREEKKRKEEKRAEKEREARKKKEEAEEQARLQQEEEERQRLELQKKEEEAVYDEWKGLIEVEASGVTVDEQEDPEGLLHRFVEYVKTCKVVNLDDLSSEFHLSTQDVVARINELEESGFLSGIIDEKGKYIFVSPEEFEDVARFIERRGRVNVNELVKEVNNIVKLEEAEA